MQIGQPYDEFDLIRRFQTGAIEAFTEIYDRHHFFLYQYAKRLLVNKQEAEDVVAETFIKLLQRRDSMESLEKISAFLKISVRNACLDLLRHHKIKSEKQADLIQEMLAAAQPDYDWIEIRNELLDMVYAQVDKMPPKMRDIFLLSFKEGLSPREIADKLDLSVQTISNQKYNALKLIRMALGKSVVIAFLLLSDF